MFLLLLPDSNFNHSYKEVSMSSRPIEKNPKITGGLSSIFSSAVAAVLSKGKVDDSAKVDKALAMKNYQGEDPPGITP
jgi:hypothetical protein